MRSPEDSIPFEVVRSRRSTADIIIEDPAISNVHAHFEVDSMDDSVCVQDVGSSNGTFINREPLQPHTPVPLHLGDCVRFGQSIFYFVPNAMLGELLRAPPTAGIGRQ